MVTNLVLPELGENIKTGVVAKVLVAVGDHVDFDQPIIEIETDKAVVEVPSDETGVVTEIFVEIGDEIKIGQKMIAIESDSVSGESEQAAVAPPESDSKNDKPDDEAQGASTKTTDGDHQPRERFRYRCR